MSQLLPQLITAAVVGALSPVATIATIAILTTPRSPVANALALLAGWAVVLVALGTGMLAVLHDSDGLSDYSKAVLNLILGQLLISSGLRNLIGARHPLRHALEGDPHRHREIPHWMRALDSLTPIKAFGLGAMLLLISPADLAVYLSAMQGVSGQDVSGAARLPLAVLLVAAIDLCIIVPLVIYLAMPRRATALLGQLRTWLLDNERRLLAWVLIVFGIWLLVSGLARLL